MRLRALAFVALCGLWSCGGGGGSQTVPAVRSGGSSVAAASARFTITVPSSASASSSARTPAYVSAATQSIVITLTSVNGAAYTGSPASVATNLSTLTPGCSGVPLTCTVTAPAVIGTDVFSVVTYDAMQILPFTSPTGHVLSQATLSVAVVAGPNTVTTPLVLNGVATTITATFPSDPHISGSMAAGYSIIGNQPYTMSLTAKDASGATIVGAGAPTFSATSASSAVSVSASGNTATVQVKSYSATPVNVTITPSYGTAATVAVTTVQELWISNNGNATVTGYVPGTNTPIASDTITSDLSANSGIAFDANGVLWVANSGTTGDTVTAYVPGTNTPIAADTISTGQQFTIALAFDASGHLWVANAQGSKVTAYVPGNSTPIAADTITSAGGLDGPAAIAFDPSGNLWVANTGNGTITAYAPGTNTAIAADTISTSLNYFDALAFDASGHLWLASSSSVTAFVPPAAIPADTINDPHIDSAWGLAFDGAGNVWVANGNSGTVTAYAPGTSTEIAADTITGLHGPFSLTFAP